MDQNLIDLATPLTKRDRVVQLLKENGRMSRPILDNLVGGNGHFDRVIKQLEVNGIIRGERCECGHTIFYQLTNILNRNGKKKTIQRRR